MLTKEVHNETVTTGIEITIQQLKCGIIFRNAEAEEMKKDLNILMSYVGENEDFDFEEIKLMLT